MCGLLAYRLRLAQTGLGAHTRQLRTRYPVTETCDRLKCRGSEASLCLRKESQPVRNSERLLMEATDLFQSPVDGEIHPSWRNRETHCIKSFEIHLKVHLAKIRLHVWGDYLTNREWSGNKRAEREERHKEDRAISRFSIIALWIHCSCVFSVCPIFHLFKTPGSQIDAMSFFNVILCLGKVHMG